MHAIYIHYAGMYCLHAYRNTDILHKPEPIIILSILPIILSRISYIFHQLFLFYSHTITYYSIIIPQI